MWAVLVPCGGSKNVALPFPEASLNSLAHSPFLIVTSALCHHIFTDYFCLQTTSSAFVPLPPSYKGSYDVGLTWITHLNIFNSIIFAKSLLQYKVMESQEPRIRMWTSWETEDVIYASTVCFLFPSTTEVVEFLVWC